MRKGLSSKTEGSSGTGGLNTWPEESITSLKALLEERIAENESAIQGATNNTDEPGILGRVLERYRQGYRGALGSGWRGSN